MLRLLDNDPKERWQLVQKLTAVILQIQDECPDENLKEQISVPHLLDLIHMAVHAITELCPHLYPTAYTNYLENLLAQLVTLGVWNPFDMCCAGPTIYAHSKAKHY